MTLGEHRVCYTSTQLLGQLEPSHLLWWIISRLGTTASSPDRSQVGTAEMEKTRLICSVPLPVLAGGSSGIS